MRLSLYNFYHLNLAYSAIAETDRARVIERCYWPLLDLARRRDLPFSIELSGYTLETIQSIDPSWVEAFSSLIHDGQCELIGSGYAQVIGPLIPHEVTTANLRIGHALYERFLGVRPQIALLNEQAFSAGLVPLYKEQGYDAIIMEWNNPGREHPEWDPEWRYFPQRALGTEEAEIALIWNESISFQKFQRYVHGELELDELIAYVKSQIGSYRRALPLYGNDIEIFDFRPGRYLTETTLHGEGEWIRIDRLYATLQDDPDLQFIKTSAVLGMCDDVNASQLLDLTSAAQPIPVKKQRKYNVVRWGVTGRNDTGINSRCWRLYAGLLKNTDTTDSDWQELCYLWSSDFRTHIREERWNAFLTRLSEFEQRRAVSTPANTGQTSRPQEPLRCNRNGRYLEIEGDNLAVRLNCRKGLAIDAYIDKTISSESLFGTLHHGYFDDILWSADFYSGHFVFESPGKHKVTDLVPVEPSFEMTELGLEVSAVIQTALGDVCKRWVIDDVAQEIRLRYQFTWQEPIVGSLRLGYVTLNPVAFDEGHVAYQSHNGGRDFETFLMTEEIDHGSPLSFLLSANQAIGMTEGIATLGEVDKKIRIRVDKAEQALLGMIMHQTVSEKKFTRMCLSALEHDDTSKPSVLAPFDVEIRYSLKSS